MVDPSVWASDPDQSGESYADYIARKYPDPDPPSGGYSDWTGLRARRQQPPPPHAPRDHPPPPAYAATALEEEVATVAASREGTRETTLNNSAFSLGQLVGAGVLDRTLVEDRLRAAATPTGLPSSTIEAKLRRSIDDGIRNPRDIPPLTAVDHQVTEVEAADIASDPDARTEPTRRLVLTCAADIKPRRVLWLWAARVALGTLALLAGREGLGKSTLAYWLVAQITRGTIPGEYFGQPRAALVCATEDSWEHTIVPRLIAAGADLTRVYRVEVLTVEDVHGQLSLPRDLLDVEEAASQVGAALLLLDPLMSRLSSSLDTHKDGEVRLALEPLVSMADRTGMAVLGLIHHNKSASTDPLQLVMASKAFTAVARSVHTVVPDPDDDSDTRRLFGTPKNNLGRSDLPTMSFTVTSYAVETDDGTAWTGRVVWGEDSPASIADAMRRAADQGEDRSAVTEAAAWLEDYLTINGDTALSADVKRDGQKADHSFDALKRARRRLNLEVLSTGYPRRTSWARTSGSNPPVQLEQESEQSPRGDSSVAPTTPTGPVHAQLEQDSQLEHSEQDPARVAPTGALPVDLDAGRCSNCRWHIEKQGHRADCPRRKSAWPTA